MSPLGFLVSMTSLMGLCACTSITPEDRIALSEPTVERGLASPVAAGPFQFAEGQVPTLSTSQSQFHAVDGLQWFERATPYSQIAGGLKISIESDLLPIHQLTNKPYKALALSVSDSRFFWKTPSGPWSIDASVLSAEVPPPDRVAALCQKKQPGPVSIRVEISSVKVDVRNSFNGVVTEEPQAGTTFVFPVSCD